VTELESLSGECESNDTRERKREPGAINFLAASIRCS
jgi:hypothetical protein